MSRIERISAILVKLQSRRIITARQIADEFGISLRTVYRDIRILEESGVPIFTNPGIGYSIVEGYKLPPLMFSVEEAIAFLMAEKQLSLQNSVDGYELYRSGMDKIRTVLRLANRDVLEEFENNIDTLELGKIQHEPTSSNVLHPLIRCIIEKKSANIEYKANYNNETTSREIDPVGLFFMFGQWYLMGWCRLRSDYRTFKLNRIGKIESMDNHFEKSHPPVKALVEQIYSSPPFYNVVIKVEKSAMFGMGTLKYYHGLVSEVFEGDYVIQTYKTNTLDYFSRWYLSFADKAVIEEPTELKEIVNNLIDKLKTGGT